MVPRHLVVFVIGLSLLVCGLIISSASVNADSSPIIEATSSEQSTVPAGTTTFDIYRTNTVTFSYVGGTVTLSTCPNQACSWAIDDMARLAVTRPDGTQATRDFVSNTKDFPAADVTDLFLAGSNIVYVELIDLMGPVRGLPRPLYLIESSSPLPRPDLPVRSFPQQLRFGFHPNVKHSRDPVNTLTGSYTYMHSDISIAGRGPTPNFVRSYDSANSLGGPLGLGWTHNYDMRLAYPDASLNDVAVLGPTGRADIYHRNADGSFTAPSGVLENLKKNGDGTYTLTNKGLTSWTFGETGRLLRITDRHGNQSTLYYNSSDQLIGVTDPAGRGSLSFSYGANGRLISVTDWINRVVTFGYDSNGRLTTARDREGNTTTYGYEGTSHRIAGIVDARGNTVATNTYDSQGRVATQKDARGLTTGQQTTFTYNSNADGSKTTVATYPATSFATTWRFVEEDTYDVQGRIIKRVSKPVTSSSEWITEEYGYDASGNRTSVKDGQGNTTLFCYDVDFAGMPIPSSRGNLTRQIQPSPTVGANRPVLLFKYDSRNNLVQAIEPKGVVSSASTNCTTNLTAGLNLLYATTHTYDVESQTKLLSSSRSYTDPDLGLQVATTKYEYGDTTNPGLPTRIIPPRGNTTSTPDYGFATTYTYGTAGSQAGMAIRSSAPANTTTLY